MITLFWGDGDDWLLLRRSPRLLFPLRPGRTPEPQRGPLSNDDVIPKPSQPIFIEGPVGIGLHHSTIHHPLVTAWGHLSERLPVISIALPTPFVVQNVAFAKRAIAYWDDCFNTWQIPLRQPSIKVALAWIEEAIYECDWGGQSIELHWNLPGCNEAVKKGLRDRIKHINNGKAPNPLPLARPIVTAGLTQAEIEEMAKKTRAIQEGEVARPHQQSLRGLSIAYLRHQRSDYHAMLWWRHSGNAKAKVRTAISQAYPFLF